MQSVISSVWRSFEKQLSTYISQARKRQKPFTAIRKMSQGTDHLQRTACNTREEVISPATIIRVRDESKTVKSVRMKIQDQKFTFKAGQWVDTFIPGLDTVGGFSICSSPRQLEQEGFLDLSVKYSTHLPAHWVHTKCKEGMTVKLRSGGDVYFDPKPQMPQIDILLVAGGIGINPLYSILLHVLDLANMTSTDQDNLYRPGKLHLMYSAKTVDELIFKDELQMISSSHPNIDCDFFVTKETTEDKDFKNRRMTESDVENVWSKLRKDKTFTFLCGPSPMITSMETALVNTGFNKKLILYEKWW